MLEVRADAAESISDGWQPIETAPKDRAIWVYAETDPGNADLEDFQCQASWHNDAGWIVSEYHTATHWCPLPPRPSP